MKSHRLPALACILGLCGTTLALPPQVRVVKAGAAPGGNGESWSQAYASLQDAMDDAASGGDAVTEIWVAEGTYSPSRERFPGDPATRTFLLVDGVAIYGGFAGTESSRSQRDPVAHPAILAGDTLSPRPHHIVTADGISTAVLDGFTITGGQAAGLEEHSRGGGVLITNASPLLANCRIVLNKALAGGGVSVESGSPTIQRCEIISNEISTASLGGGGIVVMSGTLTVIESMIAENLAIGPTHGGGIAVIGGSLTLDRSRLLANYAQSAGALSCTQGSLTATNSLFMDNFGGLVGQDMSLVNCTIYRNQAAEPGVWSGVNGTGTLVNSIVWGNAEKDLEGIVPQVWGGIDVSYSCVEPNSMGQQISGIGLTRADPKLAADGRIGEYSPAIDSGMNAALDASFTTDLDGDPRRVDDVGLPETGPGPKPRIDMGAFEFQGATCYANCDGSSAPAVLTIADFSCFMSRFAAGDPLANCDNSTGSPILNISDFSCFTGRFIAGCP